MTQPIPNPLGLYTPGPSFDAAPSGDAERQAIDSLRGYAYQIAASAAVWLDLDDATRLYLEVAEDYATVAADSLKAVQVKDTKGAVTLNSQGIRDALDHYVNLVALNPNRAVEFQYLTTSDIAAEHQVADRPAGEAGLLYWRKAASGADVKPLRAILEGANFSDEVRRFVRDRPDDEALRRDLLRRIHWQCGQPNLSGLQREIEDRLVVLGTDRYRLFAPDTQRLANVLMYQVLRKSVSEPAEARVLTRADLDKAVYAATGVTLQQSTVQALIATNAGLTGALLGGGAAPLAISSPALSWLVPSADIPRPPGLITRPTREKSIVDALAGQGLAFAYGATGVGKSLLARELRAGVCGRFRTCRFEGRDGSGDARSAWRNSRPSWIDRVAGAAYRRPESPGRSKCAVGAWSGHKCLEASRSRGAGHVLPSAFATGPLCAWRRCANGSRSTVFQ